MNPILLRIALRSLIRRSRKNLVVAGLIAVGVAAFFVGNAVLESSIGGIQRTFSDNFTADLSISEHSEQSFSLFGPDIPVIGEYESEPVLLNAADIGTRVSAYPGVDKIAYVLSSPLLVEAGGARDGGLGLGVIGEEYFSLFHDVKFVSGSAPVVGSAGVGSHLGRVGKEDRIRAGQASCSRGQDPALLFPQPDIQYPWGHPCRRHPLRPGERGAGENRHRRRPHTSRSCGVFAKRFRNNPVCCRGQPCPHPRNVTDVDSLFSGSTGTPAPDTAGDTTSPVSITELQKIMQEAHTKGASVDASPLGHNGAWHFILVRTLPGADKGRIAETLRAKLKKAGMSVQVRDWRGTAGAVALYVYLMQFVLFVGLFMVGGIVLILTINSLVMSVFERTGEIGTMRAIGAPRGFIRGLFVVETSALTVISALAGILLGTILVFIIDTAALQFNNQLLVLLFGGNALHPDISGGNILVSVSPP